MRWYHGTPAQLEPGTLIVPGKRRFKESAKNAVSITPRLDDAQFWALTRNKVGYVYEVEPVGEVQVRHRFRGRVVEALVPQARVKRLVMQATWPPSRPPRANPQDRTRVEKVVGRVQRQPTWQPKLHGGPRKHPRNFSTNSLVEGALVELEHTDDPRIAVEIAMAHLDEDRDYYKKLAKMEGRASNPTSWKRLMR